DWPLHRRLAAGPPRGPEGRAALPRRRDRGVGHVLHRHAGRDFRRRAALYAARLRRSGLERRRGLTRLGQDRRIGELWAAPGGGGPQFDYERFVIESTRVRLDT